MGIIKLGMHSRVKRILELLVVSCQESGRLILSEEEHGRRGGKKYQLQQRAWKQGRDLAAANGEAVVCGMDVCREDSQQHEREADGSIGRNAGQHESDGAEDLQNPGEGDKEIRSR